MSTSSQGRQGSRRCRQSGRPDETRIAQPTQVETRGHTEVVPDPTPVSCSLCGSTVSAPPLTWVYEADRRRGDVWVCDGCARTHLRAIEAKLDQQWW